MSKIILVTGASSGFGRLAAEALARSGHTVYASMRATTTRNAGVVAQMARYAQEHSVDLRTVELDVQSQDSADAAIAQIIGEAGKIDVVVHNAGHMVFGPAEAFTAEQYAELYDVNVLGTFHCTKAFGKSMLAARLPGLLPAMDEAIQIGKAGGVPVVIYHFKASGRRNWPLAR